MGIPDLITTFCDSPQVITTDAQSEHIIEYPSDKMRSVFIHSENMIRIIVAVAVGDLTQGMRVEFRFDMQADLQSGNQIIAGESRILLPEVLTLRSIHQFRVSPIALPEGYDFAGLFFDVINTAGDGAFAVYADLVDGAERLDVVDPAL